MKPTLKLLICISLIAGLFSSCAGTYYLAARPAEPVYVRPAAPYAGAYWVPGEYVWRGGNYVYVNGYWTRPRAGRVYMRGHWQNTPHGYTWHRGYWR